MESWSSTAYSPYGVDLGVKSTPLQSNKITGYSRRAELGDSVEVECILIWNKDASRFDNPLVTMCSRLSRKVFSS